MSESFADLFEESLKTGGFTPGSIVSAEVQSVDDDWVTVDAGLKSFGLIPVKEFIEAGELGSLAVGDVVRVAVVDLEDGFGATVLSRLKARQIEVWKELEQAHAEGEVVTGKVSGKVRGGLTVDLGTIRAFMPGSLADIRPVRDTSYLEGQDIECKIVKLDSHRNNVVVSRRAVLEEANSAEREKLLSTLDEGLVLKGLVKNLTDYGAFIDLGGIDGLLHITDLAWHRVKHPSEVLKVGDEIDVKILKYDREKNRVSLGYKQLTEDPWKSIADSYPVNSRQQAVVTNITDYGCFAQLKEGVEGLVHVSEIDWATKNIHPSRVVTLGESIDVVVLEIDTAKHRISLSIKRASENPWATFAEQYAKNTKVSGAIKSITDFGIFIGLDGGIDGLVHVSDIAWDTPGEEAVKGFKKGEEVEAIVLGVDIERERISLGIKQLQADPWSAFADNHQQGEQVSGTIKEVGDKQVSIELADEVLGQLKQSDTSISGSLKDAYTVGDELATVIKRIDRNKKQIALSVKAKEQADTKAAMKAINEKNKETVAPTTIGDLIKQQLDSNE